MLSRNALAIMQERYLWTDPVTGQQETPEEMFHRVAKCMAAAETTPELQVMYTEKYYQLLSGLYFLPNTPALINAGRPLGQLSACFVLPVEDSTDSIFEAVKHAAIIHKSGGGVGYSFSRLREQGAMVNSTGRVASGPVTFMEVFDAATETIKQGGVRRGANLGLLRVDHPDILQFINAKRQEGKLSNFNLSVGLTDKFMRALEQDNMFELVSPRDGQVKRRVKASEIMAAIVENAWATGEPGVIFLDTVNASNPLPALGEIEATNPCGEQPLFPYESCVLGSINLFRHLRWYQDGRVDIDFNRLEETVRLGVRFLDASIDVSKAPLPQIEEMTKANRKIGLGVMGWADMLLGLGVRYDSQQALDLVDRVMGRIYEWADDESRRLAKEKGPFPNSHLAEETVKGRRNATVTTIAPTGSISILAGCSNGIEPIFGYAQVSKRQIIKEVLFELNQVVARWCQDNGVDLSQFQPSRDNLDQALAEVSRLNRYLDGVLPDYFVTAGKISPEWHVKMQAAFQRYVENAISKTINLPNHASRKDVEQAYLLGYSLGVKGMTVYRDGSREEQVVYTEAKNLAKDPLRYNPDELNAKRYRVKTEDGRTAYIIVSTMENGQIWEIFNKGLDDMQQPWTTEALFRIVSIALRGGIPPQHVMTQLEKANRNNGGHMFTLPAQIRRALARTMGESSEAGVCLHCGGIIRQEGGCVTCPCGRSSRCD